MTPFTQTSITNSTCPVWATWTVTSATSSVWFDWVESSTCTTPEEIAAKEAHRRAIEAQLEAERKRREAAERRAEQLLVENLALKERERFLKEGHIVVHGRSGCRYRIRRGRTGNVDVIDKAGRITHRLCAHPVENVPDCDTMLAQKLMLECEEHTFIKIANRHPHYGDSAPVLPALH